MKQVISLLLAAIVLLCLAGCSPAPIPSEATSITQKVQQLQDPQKLQELQLMQKRPELQEGQFVFTRENFPKLDGSTSTVPLAQAMAAILLSEEQEQVEDLVQFSRTTRSYRALIQFEYYDVDLLLAAEPAPSVLEEKEESGFEWVMEPFAIDGLVFMVNENNPVDSLTVEQVQKIYTGEITNWSQVGGDDVEIIPFQRNEEAGSQTMMQKLVMGTLTMLEPPVEYRADSMSGLMEAVRGYENSTGAIGYSVYYYANDMRMAEGLKILKINGMEPGADSFRDKSYPFTNPYYVVMAAGLPKDDPTAILFDWILSEEGQRLVDQLGYVAVQPPAEETAAENVVPPVYANWSMLEAPDTSKMLYSRYWPESQQELIPHDSYGTLIPFYGKNILLDNGYQRSCFGLATLDGKVVVDPNYEDIYTLFWEGKPLPVYALRQTIVGEMEEYADDSWSKYEASEYLFGLAAQDGSWYIPQKYSYAVTISPSRILLIDPKGIFWLCDLEGTLVQSPLTSTAADYLGERWAHNLTDYFEDTTSGLNQIIADLRAENALEDDARTEGDTPDTAEEPAVGSGLELREGSSSSQGVYDTANDTWVIPPQRDSLSLLTDAVTNETYIIFDSLNLSGKHKVYNAAGELLFEVEALIRPCEGIFSVRDGDWSGLIDKDGNWIMRFPLQSNTD